MKRYTPLRNTRTGLQRLVRVALRRWNTDASWRAITELQMRGSAQTLSLAAELARSFCWRRRALGLYIASQLRRGSGFSSVEFELEKTQRLLLAGLRDGRDEVVLAAVSGLGHRPHPEALDGLIRLSFHRNEDMRFNVAVALGRYDQSVAVDALLRLAMDVDGDVRDGATFGLGSLQTADTAEIREGLWRNLNDADEDVRGEALVGLALRGDERLADLLLQLLTPECRVYELDAAQALADPRLLPALQRVADDLERRERSGYWYGRLLSALEACRGSAAGTYEAKEAL